MNKILLYSFSVKLFGVLCVHWGIMPINVGTGKHNILSQHILNGDEVKGHVCLLDNCRCQVKQPK